MSYETIIKRAYFNTTKHWKLTDRKALVDFICTKLDVPDNAHKITCGDIQPYIVELENKFRRTFKFDKTWRQSFLDSIKIVGRPVINRGVDTTIDMKEKKPELPIPYTLANRIDKSLLNRKDAMDNYYKDKYRLLIARCRMLETKLMGIYNCAYCALNHETPIEGKKHLLGMIIEHCNLRDLQ